MRRCKESCHKPCCEPRCKPRCRKPCCKPCCEPRCKPKKCYTSYCGKKYEKCETNDCCDEGKRDCCEVKCRRCTEYFDYVKIGNTNSEEKVKIKAIRKGNLIALDLGHWLIPNPGMDGLATFNRVLDPVYRPKSDKFYIVRFIVDALSTFGLLIVKCDGHLEWGSINLDPFITGVSAEFDSTGINYSV